jgi:hypothetical protein
VSAGWAIGIGALGGSLLYTLLQVRAYGQGDTTTPPPSLTGFALCSAPLAAALYGYGRWYGR